MRFSFRYGIHAAFIKALEEYIDYCDNKRIKSRLKGKSSALYRTLSK
ncbi:IS3 family transposase [uncultured Bacteroides sp.]